MSSSAQQSITAASPRAQRTPLYGYAMRGRATSYGATSAVSPTPIKHLSASSYDPTEDVALQPYGYSGRRYDQETDLWYFRARYFDAELGRFISRDPLGYVDGMSMYRGYFVPNGLDPRGLGEISNEEKLVFIEAELRESQTEQDQAYEDAVDKIEEQVERIPGSQVGEDPSTPFGSEERSERRTRNLETDAEAARRRSETAAAGSSRDPHQGSSSGKGTRVRVSEIPDVPGAWDIVESTWHFYDMAQDANDPNGRIARKIRECKGLMRMAAANSRVSGMSQLDCIAYCGCMGELMGMLGVDASSYSLAVKGCVENCAAVCPQP